MTPPRPISRQRAWQRAQHADGRCQSCGKPDARTRSGMVHCANCAKFYSTPKIRQRAMLHGRAVHGWKPWRKGGRGRPPIDRMMKGTT